MLYQTQCYTFLFLQFTKDVVGQLNSVKIDLRGIILLEPEGKQNLQDFSEAGLSEINYADYLEEVTHTHRETGKHIPTYRDEQTHKYEGKYTQTIQIRFKCACLS